MKFLLLFLCSLFPLTLAAQEFSCPSGEADIMKYFVLDQTLRADHYLNGDPNPLFTKVFSDEDFSAAGYWFWLKSPEAQGFDVKSFDRKYVYMRSTELVWTDNTTFKRFDHDMPIAERCVPEGQPGREIKVSDTNYKYYAACHPYKSSHLGTVVNDLDAPVLMDTGGNIGRVWTRVLHYRYNCDANFEKCQDEEQFFLSNGYGLWQWKHFRNGDLKGSTLINQLQEGQPEATLPCEESYRPFRESTR